MNRIVDYPIFGNSRQNLMLTLPDVSGYIFRRWYCDEHFGKTPMPKIEQWRHEYILPHTFLHQPLFSGAVENERISPEERFKQCIQEGVSVIPPAFAVLQLLVHELVHGSDRNNLYDIAKGLQILSGRRKPPKQNE